MQLKENISLLPYNTFGMNVLARQFAEADSVDGLQQILEDHRKKSSLKEPLLILGGGSNILFTKDFDGCVIKNGLKGIQLLREDQEYYYVKAAGGEIWHSFVMHCIEKGYAGAENLSLIPGSVGAAPIQNIGAYGVEQKDIFHELEALHLHENSIRSYAHEECRFGYRDSVFKNSEKGKYIILSVTFRLSKTPAYRTSYGAISQELEKMGVKDLSIGAISQAVCNIRRSKLPDPAKIGNAGSFFKNPTVTANKFEALKKEHPSIVGYPSANAAGDVKLAAGWMIEQCGWKGKTLGSYGVHKDQALVLVNYGGSNGQAIFDLSEEILRSVQARFGVELEREVVIL